MTEKKELSQLARSLLNGAGHVTLFTQAEFDESLAVAKAEIMMIAIEATKTAIYVEREECSRIAQTAADEATNEEVRTALRAAAEAIMNRIPSQRQ